MRLLPFLVLVGCASEASVQARWDAFVDEHASCDTVDDCAVVYPSCPLGCYEAVSADAVDEANAEADRLIRAYERGGRGCDYDCDIEPALTCDAGRCGFAE
ncbi:MAG: hypothetical protein EP330_23530 [Deltaproteobacteria bacterium]|nr:MAG: hypothetical protein EP330_23530 [Deltaproteobacteria bacterium]